MTRLKPPAHLSELVRTAFSKAKSDGHLHYFATQVTLLEVNSIPFQLRFSPALANKPKATPSADAPKSSKPFDPFAYPPGPLFITDLGPSHFLVLNKFAVVPEHFILATREFRPQTHLLDAGDLESTLMCIEAYEESKMAEGLKEDKEGGLFAFFNCGDHSGASQPHRHIQLLPVARMKDGLEMSSGWDVLADRLRDSRLPFTMFSEDIHVGMSSADLHAAYIRLYHRACRAVAFYAKKGAVGGESDDIPIAGETRISYNMAMTRNTLVICPRLAEGATIRETQTGEVLGTLSLNGTLLAGTALVKSEREWDALRKDNQVLKQLFLKIGVPNDNFSEDMNKL